jgi:hypothetical protein
MKTQVTVRYVSGREDHIEMDLWGGTMVETRLKEFAKNPTIVFQSAGEIVIIPATAIECITIPVPEEAGTKVALPNVRKAKRVPPNAD